ncbi:streptococcal hemagglutinin-like [Ptychodera flava]|uniref:streptococcal hemagglutinin-like n=1 Tax=Ptychodera flava TaxID=63121 RepID=UPI00396AA8A0
MGSEQHYSTQASLPGKTYQGHLLTHPEDTEESALVKAVENLSTGDDAHDFERHRGNFGDESQDSSQESYSGRMTAHSSWEPGSMAKAVSESGGTEHTSDSDKACAATAAEGAVSDPERPDSMSLAKGLPTSLRDSNANQLHSVSVAKGPPASQTVSDADQPNSQSMAKGVPASQTVINVNQLNVISVPSSQAQYGPSAQRVTKADDGASFVTEKEDSLAKGFSETKGDRASLSGGTPQKTHPCPNTDEGNDVTMSQSEPEKSSSLAMGIPATPSISHTRSESEKASSLAMGISATPSMSLTQLQSEKAESMAKGSGGTPQKTHPCPNTDEGNDVTMSQSEPEKSSSLAMGIPATPSISHISSESEKAASLAMGISATPSISVASSESEKAASLAMGIAATPSIAVASSESNKAASLAMGISATPSISHTSSESEKAESMAKGLPETNKDSLTQSTALGQREIGLSSVDVHKMDHIVAPPSAERDVSIIASSSKNENLSSGRPQGSDPLTNRVQTASIEVQTDTKKFVSQETQTWERVLVTMGTQTEESSFRDAVQPVEDPMMESAQLAPTPLSPVTSSPTDDNMTQRASANVQQPLKTKEVGAPAAAAPADNIKDNPAMFVAESLGSDLGRCSLFNLFIASLVAKLGVNVFAPVLQRHSDGKTEEIDRESRVRKLYPNEERLSKLKNQIPAVDWFHQHQSLYPHFTNFTNDVKTVVGYLSVGKESGFLDAAVDFKNSTFRTAKMIHFNLAIPEDYGDTEGEDSAIESIKGDHVVVSLGHLIHEHFENKYEALEEERPRHLLYLPPVLDKFMNMSVVCRDGKVCWQVLSVCDVKTEDDFERYTLGARAMGKLAKANRESFGQTTNWKVIGVKKDVVSAFKKFLQDKSECTSLQVTVSHRSSLKDLGQYLLQSMLFIAPERNDSFHFTAYLAMQTGIPVLVPSCSGIFTFLERLFHLKDYAGNCSVQTNVNDGSLEEDSNRWKDAMLSRMNPERRKVYFHKAKQLKEDLKNCAELDKSHMDFLEELGVLRR